AGRLSGRGPGGARRGLLVIVVVVVLVVRGRVVGRARLEGERALPADRRHRLHEADALLRAQDRLAGAVGLEVSGADDGGRDGVLVDDGEAARRLLLGPRGRVGVLLLPALLRGGGLLVGVLRGL